MSILNPYFEIGGLVVKDMPKHLIGDNWEDFLSDMDDGYKISYFIKKYPSLHKIKFKSFDKKSFYSTCLNFSDYKNWTQEMKDFWLRSKESQWDKDYQVKSIENGITTIRYRYDYESIEMKSLLVNPLNLHS
jgi:hypothetical protein